MKSRQVDKVMKARSMLLVLASDLKDHEPGNADIIVLAVKVLDEVLIRHDVDQLALRDGRNRALGKISNIVIRSRLLK